MLRKCCSLLAFSYCKLLTWLFNVRVENIDNLFSAMKRFDKIIITGNHENRLDGLFLVGVIRSWRDVFSGRLVGTWSKEENFKKPLLGFVYSMTDTGVSLSRKPGCLTINKLERTCSLLSRHQLLIAFLQGSTQKQHLRFPPKTGPVRAALFCDAAVLPVKILPRRKVNLFRTLFRLEGVVIRFGAARKLKNVRSDDFFVRKKHYRSLTNALWDEINHRL